MAATVAEHRKAVTELVRAAVQRNGRQDDTVGLLEARNRILARDISAPVSLPPFANSQMDGYAVDSAAAGSRSEFTVAETIAAGYPAPPLAAGFAAPIMTGAMLPAGADAVVPIEQADPDGFRTPAPGLTVRLPASVPAGQFVRAEGSDVAAGTLALAAGTRLKPAQLGLLAALGVAEVAVRPRLRVLLLSTGDEVIAPGGALGPGQIFDANTTLLAAALAEAGADVAGSRILADSPEDFLARLHEDLERHEPDLLLTSGGISKGAFEVVKQALARDQVEFGSVAMQPGGPQAIGTVAGVAYLGFPGNPVSSLVSFETFLRPALSEVLGDPEPRTVLQVPLAEAVQSPEAKHQIRRGHYDGGSVTLIGGPGSHLLHALAASNALVHFPVGVTEVPAGRNVEVWLL
ncbi:molybdopterin molybdotransferase MoeA [Arthrobacter crystallopoietes]|uniref:molybdopterin molybdotransferase MoeA n=1 Tax=Crystallibacter crystallopoietes TaxID=37928 RepID=UPI0011113FF6|nr:gephyrin-like molybdotransferase Glp [Arthrobacter crystallopoietes]